MSAVSDTLLARMRAQVSERLYDTAVIQSVSNASDGAGGVTPTWSAVVGGTVLCRLDPLGQTSMEAGVVANREALTVSYRLTMPYNAPIEENCRVVVNGNTYEVVALAVDHSKNVSRRGIVTEVR